MLECLGIFSPPSLLVVDMSIPDILMLHSSLPDTHLFKYNWIGLYITGVSGREKQYGNFNKTDADFIVCSEVYELLLTRIWLPQIMCCRAGRERTGVLPFPGSSVGENEQETPMKAVLIQEKTRTEKWEHWKVPPKNQYCHLWTWQPKSAAFQNFLCKRSWLLGRCKLYLELVAIVA